MTLEPDQDPLVGRVLADRFRVEARLGVGAMGAVYRARHLSLQRDVAIKVLHAHLTDDAMVAKRFDREAVAASKLDHPNCVQVLDSGTAEGGLEFIVMQLLAGRELRRAIDGPMPVERAIEITRQILLGLEHAHRRGLVHRDLKPENVFLVPDDDGRDIVKIVDFGIVKLLCGDGSDERLTRAGMVFGTPAYMSPEQAAGGKVDERADLYAVGVLLFEMLAGVPPFRGDEPGIVLRMHLIADPPPLPDSVPLGVRGVVMRLLEKDAKDRFASARDAREALEAGLRVATPKDITAAVVVPAPPPPPSVAPPPPASTASSSRVPSSGIVFMRADAVQPAERAPGRGFPLLLLAITVGVASMIGTVALAMRGCASSKGRGEHAPVERPLAATPPTPGPAAPDATPAAVGAPSPADAEPVEAEEDDALADATEDDDEHERKKAKKEKKAKKAKKAKKGHR